ncbi:hypothetical protein [Desulfosarcina cetonica]|uniref:hypothetical protein n=1 Tax=Desulfosarcina cetonica TaxID=90730 RepID=UPI0012EE5A89|nr:hypothetical protein [Desulfosarcina cetonica]
MKKDLLPKTLLAEFSSGLLSAAKIRLPPRMTTPVFMVYSAGEFLQNILFATSTAQA